MFRRFSVNFAIFSIFLDSCFIIGSLALAVYVRPSLNKLGFIKDLGPEVIVPYWVYLAFVLIWIGIFLASSLYDGKRNLQVVEELTTFSLASGLAVIASAGILYLSFRDLSRFLFLMFVMVAVLVLGGWRMFYRWLINRRVGVNGHRRVLIVGTGEVGLLAWQQIMENFTLGLEFVGFASEENHSSVMGGYKDARRLVEEERIDDVVIALPRKDHLLVNSIVNDLYEIPVRVWLVPDYFSLALHKAGVEEYAGITMFDLRAPAISDYQRLVKRAFDLLLTVLMLPFAIPLGILVSVLILLFDRGPILFIQERAGENGKPFRMVKFRTMAKSSENFQLDPTRQHKNKVDPRVTIIGKILRKTSLDELPQLFNVLKGEMSLVGPRPEMLELVDKYENWQRTRFTVPPGLTGWWQVNGRSDRPMHLHTEDDIYYINNYSLWLDIQILLRTIWVVIVGRGAF
jgi:exopolysaccharide biosynthesis polyprenyl glycosylphosphotransferase